MTIANMALVVIRKQRERPCEWQLKEVGSRGQDDRKFNSQTATLDFFVWQAP